MMSGQRNPDYKDLSESTLLDLKQTFIKARKDFLGVHAETVANCDRGIAQVDAELAARR